MNKIRKLLKKKPGARDLFNDEIKARGLYKYIKNPTSIMDDKGTIVTLATEHPEFRELLKNWLKNRFVSKDEKAYKNETYKNLMEAIKKENQEVYDALVFEEDVLAWEKAEIREKLNEFGDNKTVDLGKFQDIVGEIVNNKKMKSSVEKRREIIRKWIRKTYRRTNEAVYDALKNDPLTGTKLRF